MAWKNVQYENGKMRTSEGGGGGGSSTFAGLEDVNFSNLQNGQVPKYNSATQKWENANVPGGGGTVTDVEVDGVSVVNQQGVAEIPAIPDGLHHYSTTEQVIGTWIDGKPLYEKTFNQNTPLSLIANSWGATNIAYSEISAKHIVNATLEAINNSGYPVFNVGFNIAILNGYVNLNSFRNVEYNNGYTLTMQYTKTTD